VATGQEVCCYSIEYGVRSISDLDNASHRIALLSFGQLSGSGSGSRTALADWWTVGAHARFVGKLRQLHTRGNNSARSYGETSLLTDVSRHCAQARLSFWYLLRTTMRHEGRISSASSTCRGDTGTSVDSVRHVVLPLHRGRPRSRRQLVSRILVVGWATFAM